MEEIDGLTIEKHAKNTVYAMNTAQINSLKIFLNMKTTI